MSATPFALPNAAKGTGPRQAALLLHAMQVRDRDRILETLTSAQRDRLQAMLDELRELGIPPTARLVREALGANGSTTTAPGATFDEVSDAAPSTLEDIAAEVAHELLRGEPDTLVVRALSAASPTWRREVLGEFDAARREVLRSALRATSGSNSGSASRLTREIEVCLHARARTATTSAPGTFLATLARRLRRTTARMIDSAMFSRAWT